MKPETWKLIDELAKARGIADLTRAKWRQRGVPFRFHASLMEDAKARGIALSQDDLRPAPVAAKAA